MRCTRRFSSFTSTHVLAGSLALLTTTVLAGCPDRQIAEVNPDQGKVEIKTIPLSLNRNLDLLFVIDNSGSMAEEQAILVANFSRFVDVLNTIEGGLPDIHLGVVTSDVGTDGGRTLSGTGGCSGNGDNGTLQTGGLALTGGKFISDIRAANGTDRVKNYSGSLADAFTQIATVGSAGCGFEQHLESMKRALDGTNAANTGFLRDDAFLAVVVLADEDDCSVSNPQFFNDDPNPATGQLGYLQSFRCTEFGVVCDGGGDPRAVGPRTGCTPRDDSPYLHVVSEYADFLKGLKPGHENRVVVSTIQGNPTPFAVTRVTRSVNNQQVEQPALAPSCTYTAVGSSVVQHADPGVRLNFFAQQFPNRSSISTICGEELQDALIDIATLLKTVIGTPCIEGQLADPVTCTVTEVVNAGETSEGQTIVPECDASHSVKPCWHLDVDTLHCMDTPTQKAMAIDRDGAAPPSNAELHVACQLAGEAGAP